MRASKKELVEEKREMIEFENTLDHDVTIRNPTERYGRQLPPHGGSNFTDIKVGDRIMLPEDRGRKLKLTPVNRLPKQDKQ